MDPYQINRRDFFKMIGTATTTLIANPLIQGCSKHVYKKPNIILIYADDLDFDDISPYENKKYPCYSGMKELGFYQEQKDGWFAQNHRRLPRGEQGYYTTKVLTPNIERLANEGAILERFYITTPTCTPSRYTLLTGRYASRSPDLLDIYPENTPANITWNTYLLPGETHIASEMKKNGYATGFVGKWHNGTGNLKRKKVIDSEKSKNETENEVIVDPTTSHRELSFEERASQITLDRQQRGMLPDDADPFDPKVFEIMKKEYDYAVNHIQDRIGFDFVERVFATNKEAMNAPKCMRVHNLDWITEGALKFIDHNAEKPFFLYMPVTVPHGQYYSTWIEENPLATPAGMLDKRPDVQPSRENILQRLDEKDISRQTAMATWLDDSIGAVIKRLDVLNLTENTVVIFTSDHQSRGKFTCHEGCRVPFIIRWPEKIKAGGRIHALHGNVDIAKTLIEMAGGMTPTDMSNDSKSMLPALINPEMPGRDSILLESGYTKAIVSGDWKYIANRPPENVMKHIQKEIDSKPDPLDRSINWNGSQNWNNYEIGVIYGANRDFPNYYDKDHLYNIKEDPFERVNQINNPMYSDVLADLKKKLKKELKTLPHTFAEFKE